MKFSEKWLREWVEPGLSTRALTEQLTMAGLEVESCTTAGKPVTNVVVAEIKRVERHPDAERLTVCTVFDGTAEFQIVCGAPNARGGIRVPFAREGAALAGITIKRAKLRGVESFGMLCSGDELGLEGQSEGLLELAGDARLGSDINRVLDLDDQIIELGLTPNRGDCLGIAGLAREVAALNRCPINRPVWQPVAASIDDDLKIELLAPEGCPRYVGRVIRGVDMTVPSPLWLRERLRRAGVRSIDAVVDVTNYVMIETGQPMHAFDRGCIADHIIVRLARDGERLQLLDGSECTLRADSLVIADMDKPVALAGIMGGADSAVSESTRDLLLEAAFFAPLAMAGKARSHGMHTDASHRFERGVDFRLQELAIERATRLLLDIVGGAAGPVIVASDERHLPVLAPVRLRRSRLDDLLGITVSAAEVDDILERLDIAAVQDGEDWVATPPSHRFDIRIEADLREEIARVHGYDNIPARVQSAAVPMRHRREAQRDLYDLRRRLVTLGYQETITYSFVDIRTQALLDPERTPIPVANPISADMAVMRTTLWSGLIKALQFNQNRQQRHLRFFETGLRFLPNPNGLDQRTAIAGIICGDRWPENWANASTALDFHDIKGDVETLLGKMDGTSSCEFVPEHHPALHPGQSAAVCRAGQTIGYLGGLHPRLIQAFDLHGPVFLFELDYESIREKNLPSFKGLSKFPEVRRDIAIVVEESIPSERVLDVVRQSIGTTLVKLTLFDMYRGQHIDKGKKSMAIGCVLQNQERTLTDDEVNVIMDRLLADLGNTCDASLRA